MWRLVLDQNFNQDLFNAVKREHGKPDLDVVRVLDVGLAEAPDEVVLEWAAHEERIVLTHDIKTMVPLANSRLRLGLRMPRLIMVRDTRMHGRIVADLCIILGAGRPEEWEGGIEYLPYKRGR